MSRKISNIKKGNKSPWNDFEQERRISNRKLPNFSGSKIRKRDKNERDKEKKKLKDEGKKESEEESNNLEKYTSTMKVWRRK